MDYLMVIKQMIADGIISQEVAAKYVPELKESEDERMVKFIRKQLFNIKKTITENYELDAKLTKAIDWLEKQCNKAVDNPQNHQDVEHPNGCIVFEDFNGGEGFYKLHFDYLNKTQIREIESLVRIWNGDK